VEKISTQASPPPHEFLRALLVERGLPGPTSPTWLGAGGHTSEALSAKRFIGKGPGQEAAGFFKLTADLFI
jgi:hypothetical protein